MREICCDQGTAQWMDARRGKITASRIADALDTLKKGGEGAGRRNYRIELLAERLTGRSEDHYVSPEMAWGREYEAEARFAYEMKTGEMVSTAGFILHPTFDFAGASPDGLIGKDGGLEIKCPKTTTHIKWLLAGIAPVEHQDQCLWNMACAERSWWDFASHDPRLPEGLNLFIVRMQRDDARIAEIEAAVQAFEAEVSADTTELQKLISVTPAKPVDARSEYEQLMAMMDAAELIP